METHLVNVDLPEEANVILGQSHFIKTVEDISEIIVSTVPGMHYGLAFCEASAQQLVRHAGNDQDLEQAAIVNALAIGAGHCFILFIRDGYPINILSRIKDCPEVCRIFCATANPLQVVVCETEQGRGILGVVDGMPPKGVEDEKQINERKQLLRKIGYKF